MTQGPGQDEANREDSLKGTTLKVYRFMLKSKAPLGIHELQRRLGMSSPSVAQYHIKKLVALSLIREEAGGYVVDKLIFDNMVRIRRTTIPIQTAYVAFFACSLAVILTILRPGSLTSTYAFSLVVIAAALIVSVYETVRSIRRL